ncbi:MAG: S41 family peptidase [Pseudomonadota bacterium]
MRFTRRALCLAGASALATPAFAAEPSHDVTADQDFDELWETLRDRYCYFAEKRTDWARVRRMYRPLAIAAETMDDYTEIVRQVLNELYDAHTHLADPPDGAPRWPLFDLYAERHEGAVRIVAVQDESAAADAGLKSGETILNIDNADIEAAIAARMPRCLTRPDPVADAYAINCAIAGHRGQARDIVVRSADGATRSVHLPLKQSPERPNLDSRAIDAFGYIRIRSFADNAVAAGFDAALANFRDTRGLIIDVRDNGGGDTAVARPIMGRFITERRAYARMRRREGAGLSAPWTEYVDPQGPFTYDKPVVVLTTRWSASMAEGFPMGMSDIGRARIVGTPMMGLGAAVYHINLDRTGIQAQYSGEPVYDTKDAPRSSVRPDVETAPDADILAAGIAELRRLTA